MIKKEITQKIEGKYVNLREIELEDADFVLSLRCSEKKSRYLHKTEFDVRKQQEYIKEYKKLNNEWYFIVENKDNNPIGTYRIYDVKEDSFCIGSWIMAEGSSSQAALETDFLVRSFGFDTLKMEKTHFDVRKENKTVVKYHKLLGAKLLGESEKDYFFECLKEDYMNAIKNLL